MVREFDIKRDVEVVNAGGFFCQACLVGRIVQSPDPRYCKKCYKFLREERKLSGSIKPPRWSPKLPPDATTSKSRRVKHKVKADDLYEATTSKSEGARNEAEK